MAQERPVNQAAASTSSDWNSLEVTKLVVAFMTPLVVLAGGWLLTRWLQKRVDTESKLIEKRIEVFDRVAPDYNDILVYLLYRGAWQELTPDAILEAKRRLDKNIHVYGWLFSGDILAANNAFMAECFATYRAVGTPAGIRSEAEPRKQHGTWNAEWDALFTDEDSSARGDAIVAAYEAVMRAITSELKRDSRSTPFVSGASEVTRG
jgi:hypothetical protein